MMASSLRGDRKDGWNTPQLNWHRCTRWAITRLAVRVPSVVRLLVLAVEDDIAASSKQRMPEIGFVRRLGNSGCTSRYSVGNLRRDSSFAAREIARRGDPKAREDADTIKSKMNHVALGSIQLLRGSVIAVTK